MGGHERADAENAERVIVKYINGEDYSELAEEMSSEYLKPAISIGKQLLQDYDIKEATHVGNTYGDSIGDIKIKTEEMEYKRIEIKITDSSTYYGATLAGMSQDLLTKFDVFPNAMAWRDFRKKEDFNDTINNFLDIYHDYPDEAESKKERARYLRDLIGYNPYGSGNVDTKAKETLQSDDTTFKEQLAARIILKIFEETKANKKRYIKYLRDKQVDSTALRKLTLLLFAGNHTLQSLRENWNDENLFDGSYVFYYGKKESDKVKQITEPDNLTALQNHPIYLDRSKDTTSITVYTDDGDERNDIIRFQLHWKNTFQGIETPCLNIFER